MFEMPKMLKNFIFEASVILGLLVILFIMGDDEMLELIGCGDTGRIIGTFGILLCIAGFVRLSTGLGETGISLLIGIGCFILGHVLHEYGIFMALFVFGITFTVFSYLIMPFSKPIAAVFLVIGISVALISYPLRHIGTPTKINAIDYVEDSKY